MPTAVRGAIDRGVLKTERELQITELIRLLGKVKTLATSQMALAGRVGLAPPSPKMVAQVSRPDPVKMVPVPPAEDIEREGPREMHQ